jgi:hypothetical protein
MEDESDVEYKKADAWLIAALSLVSLMGIIGVIYLGTALLLARRLV